MIHEGAGPNNRKRVRGFTQEPLESRLHSIRTTTISPLTHHLSLFCEHDRTVKELTEKRIESQNCVQEMQKSYAGEPILINVGGELFTFPKKTLISSDENSLFHALLYFEEDPIVPIQRDENGVIFFDRDPKVFHHIANYLRGYKKFDKLDSGLAKRLQVDAEYFHLPKLVSLLDDGKGKHLRFRPGPGVSPEGDRLRVAFGIGIVGEEEMVTGRHSITFEIVLDDYVGVGIVSDACTSTDHEFHKIACCCVYYMSGVFYNNYPHHKKEEMTENIIRFGAGDRVTINVELDKGFAEFTVKNVSKIISIGKSKRLRFAIAAKGNSAVRIV